VLIDVYSSSTNNENNYTKVKDKFMMPIKEINFENFEEYNEIIINILKNMNTGMLSKCFNKIIFL
jgi:hypothetical protein